MRFPVPILILFSGLPIFAADDADAFDSPQGSEIVERYISALAAQRENPRPVQMEMDIDAELPRLKKTGRLHAFRFVPKVGRIVYDALRFEGDNTVKKEVIARYLEAERSARSDYAGSIAISAENYKFKYKGEADYVGRTAHVFQVTPRKKRVGLFEGELWVDAKTYLPLREWGEFVKNPSVFLRSVYFVRDYIIEDGVSLPRRIISDVDTRLVGRAKLTIWYNNPSVGSPSDAAVTANGAQLCVPTRFGN
ncbi:MAG TPA: hypothetical protein VN428_21005 [Bryobacteraceae bacterium]|nr:hypothetical protein [Bryobacteraceae bacterium]